MDKPVFIQHPIYQTSYTEYQCRENGAEKGPGTSTKANPNITYIELGTNTFIVDPKRDHSEWDTKRNCSK